MLRAASRSFRFRAARRLGLGRGGPVSGSFGSIRRRWDDPWRSELSTGSASASNRKKESVKLEAEAQYVVSIDADLPQPLRLGVTRLSKRLVLMLAGRLDESGCERVVLAAYPGLARRAHAASRNAPGRWLRLTLHRQHCGLVEDLACEALRLAGVPVEIAGLDKIRAASDQLAAVEASAGAIAGRGELVRAAYPLRHPGLRLTCMTAGRRPECVVRSAACIRRQGRATRRGHVRRCRSSARAPDDPGEPEPGEYAGRAADDHVDLRVPLGAVV
jgi:hypothetical protein